MRIAGIQISAGPDRDRNVQHALELAELAAERGARIICYPELFLTPWFLKQEDKRFCSWALSPSGGTLGRFQQISEKTRTVLVIPFFENVSGVYYNSAAVFDSGKHLGTYRKLHVPDLPLYRERFYFSPGNTGLPVFETSQGRVAVQICWDNLFPESIRVLALRGADIILAPTAASQNTHTVWERAITANAFANNLFVFRVNRVGQEEGISFYGRSFCVDPWGEMVSELAGSKDAVVLADIDLEERSAAAETWGFLKKRLPGEYGDIVK